MVVVLLFQRSSYALRVLSSLRWDDRRSERMHVARDLADADRFRGQLQQLRLFGIVRRMVGLELDLFGVGDPYAHGDLLS